MSSLPSQLRLLTSTTAIIFALINLPGLPTVQAQSRFDEEEVKFAAELKSLLLDGKYAELDGIANQLRKERPIMPTGQSKLDFFYNQLSATEGNTRQEELRSIQDRITLIAGWVSATNSVTSRIALALNLSSQGWLQRGGGFADSVSGEEFREFGKSLSMAEDLLKETEKLAKKKKTVDPELYTCWMQLGLGLGYDYPKMSALMYKALELDPWYLSAESQLTLYLFPQWHGKPGDIPRLADEVSRKIKSPAGKAGYAEIAITAYGTGDCRRFSPQGLSWERTREGLKEQIKRSPDSPYLLGQLLKYSKLAHDRETAAEAVSLLRGRWDQRVFRNSEDFLRAERWSHPDFRSGSARTIIEMPSGSAISVAFTNRGKEIVGVSTNAEELLRFRVENGQTLEPWTSSIINPTHVAALPGSEHLLLAGRTIRGEPILLNLDKNGQESEVGLGQLSSDTIGLVVDRQGQYFAVGQAAGTIRRWKQAEIPQPFEWKAFTSGLVWGLAFSPDGTQLASVSGAEIAIWDLAKRTEVRRWNCHDSIVVSVAWSPDGATVATAGAGNEIRLWNPQSGERTGELIGGNSSITSLAFTSDGTRLVGATRSWEQLAIPGEIVVWSMPDRKRLATFAGHALGIWKIAISPDDKMVASASADGTIRLWDLP